MKAKANNTIVAEDRKERKKTGGGLTATNEIDSLSQKIIGITYYCPFI